MAVWDIWDIWDDFQWLFGIFGIFGMISGDKIAGNNTLLNCLSLFCLQNFNPKDLMLHHGPDILMA